MQSLLSNKYHLITITIALLSGILMITHLVYRHELKTVKALLNKALNKSIILDMENRYKEANTFFYFEQSSNKLDNATLSRGDTIISNPFPNSPDQLSAEEKRANMLQTLLQFHNPIIVESLDSIYRAQLKDNNINAITLTVYKDKIKQTTQTSCPDSLLLQDALSSEEINLGINQEMSVQSYVQVNKIQVIYREKGMVVLLYSFWILFVSLIYLLLWYHRSRNVNIFELYNPINKTPGYAYPYQITESTYFQPEKNRIIHNEKPILMRAQSSHVLKLLLDSPEHFASHKDISQLLWHSDSPYGTDTLTKAITRLRKYLEPIPEVKIVSIRKRGYELVIDRPGKDKEDDQEQKKAVPSE